MTFLDFLHPPLVPQKKVNVGFFYQHQAKDPLVNYALKSIILGS